ncbi:tRNA (N(6)-L-threonylcarbamoyladenosine(37)-C(2))-methylthiotransferase MtaB [Roseiterribacter gracilis]|uniref:tRNA (N(6)-L-threonylcarbamoyladenosine(37)-C(2))-methylthiotran sferase MtaB n=1 Tax=Roseiterribacter gracilis TaxID=2812848 RepID=A0A8S8XC91_9PROT|nr:tRNA (N(6)-L-threonylcarbamoyladenosine(37)-C(2))-methylthiotran sferase MtaB [Rhodospirillales bacterium TMPK1]
MSKLDILTFGCRLNSYESEVMRAHAEAAGLNDAIIVNTCAVTAEAERQARQAVRKAKRERPDARIVVTGCAAQIDPARWAAMPEVDRVLGNDEKLKAETWRDEPGAARIAVNDIQAVREQAGHLVAGFDGRARAFVQVQNGCDHRCTFCIIPYGRGPSRSVAIGEVVAQARALVAAGFRELVLTGVDITSYGGDLPGQPKLGQLVRRLLRTVPELDRLRLSSIDPVEIDEELWTAFAEEERLMPHLHLSIQAGDDMILKRMKRRHLRDDVLKVVERARSLRADAAFGADLIAGFPTEDDAMFANTLALVDDADLVHLHVFPYSARSGTPAARMPQLPVTIRRERAAQIRAAGERRLASFLASRVGLVERVLVETDDGRGHSEQFAPTSVVGGKPGEIVEGRVDAVTDGRLVIARASERVAA